MMTMVTAMVRRIRYPCCCCVHINLVGSAVSSTSKCWDIAVLGSVVVVVIMTQDGKDGAGARARCP